jgi:anti-anti-sigma factor
VKGLAIQAEQADGVLIARLDGRIDGQNAQDFQRALEGLLADKEVNLLLDLGQVSFLSSAGLGVLLSIARQLHKRAGKIAVCSLSDSIRGVFLISGFHKIFPTHADQRDAIAAISQ